MQSTFLGFWILSPAAAARLNVRSAHVSRRRSCAFAGVIDSRLGWGDFQQGAEVGDEELVVGALGAASRPPAGKEGVDLHDDGILAGQKRPGVESGVSDFVTPWLGDLFVNFVRL